MSSIRPRPASGRLRRRTCSMARSEEHTSELQSQSNLVCRLLLEKKKIDQARKRPICPSPSQPAPECSTTFSCNTISSRGHSHPVSSYPTSLVLAITTDQQGSPHT